MLSKSVLYLGIDESEVELIPLRAGPLSALFDPGLGFLRHVRWGDREVLRGIYGAVRDRNWNTIKPRISNLQVSSARDQFHLQFDAECRQSEIDFLWRGTLTGDPSGTIRFEFDGAARRSFLRNRIGLCILHPILECAGRRCEVELIDGRREESVFPKLISPHQPFKNVRALISEVAAGVRAEVRLEGDTFETEDQRNWTDASFKTYSTPLDLPFPVEVAAGDKVRQSATVTLLGDQHYIVPIVQEHRPQLSLLTTSIMPRPPLGLCVSSGRHLLSLREIGRLKELELAHLRVDLDFSRADWGDDLRRAVHEANALEIGLHIALVLSREPDRDLAALLAEVQKLRPPATLWLVFQTGVPATGEKVVRLLREKLSPFSAQLPLAAGTNAYFAELNRNRPTSDFSAFPCFSVNPQVHAFDRLTLVENLEAIPGTLETLEHFCPRPAVVSPVTLRPRFNPNATAAEGPPSAGELPWEVDPRQMSLFGAGWTLGCLSYWMTMPNVHSLTFYETTGWRGIMETETGSPAPDRFRSSRGSVFAMYHVLADLAGYSRLCRTPSSHPLQAVGLTLLDSQNRRRVLLANLTGVIQETRIETGPCQAEVRYLDETNVEEAMTDPEGFRSRKGELVESSAGSVQVKLLPFAVARLDLSN